MRELADTKEPVSFGYIDAEGTALVVTVYTGEQVEIATEPAEGQS